MSDRALKLREKSLHKLFNGDQLLALGKCSTRGMIWKSDTVMKALKLRFSCGSTGYGDLLGMGMPLPAIRTLQRRLQSIPFSPGILNSVFHYLSAKVQYMEKKDRICCLTLDKMEIKQSVEYDPSSRQVLGDATLPGGCGEANHALVLMLGGLAARWKQVVAYHFTGRSVDGKALKALVLEVISKAACIGLTVIAVTSDMGAGNQAMWREFGIHSTRGSVNASFLVEVDHPVYVLADIPHLVKNLCSSLLSHRTLILDANTCNQFNLTSNVVDLSHIEDLVKFQVGKPIKLTPNLTVETFESKSHFRKMNVGQALNLFSNSVSAGLKYLVEKEGRSANYLTTAWFINLVDSWFNLMSSRHPVMALSRRKIESYDSARQVLNNFLNVMVSIHIGNKASWKPVQAGIVLSTTSVLSLCERLLDTSLDFILTSRLTQDCIENLFSVVRSKNPVPTPREFKYALKLICAAQYLKEVKSSNYQLDDRQYLGDLLPKEVVPPGQDLGVSFIDNIELSSYSEISQAEEEALYYLCGYCIQSLKKSKRVCLRCIDLLAHKDHLPHPRSTYLRFKNFKSGALFEANDLVFSAFRAWEIVVRSLEFQLKVPKIGSVMKNKCLGENNLSAIAIPNCHPVVTRLAEKFVTLRLHIMCKQLGQASRANSAQYGSRSMAMRALVNKV